MRVTIRVRPGSGRTEVGGATDDAGPPASARHEPATERSLPPAERSRPATERSWRDNGRSLPAAERSRPALFVRVRARTVEGKATEAALRALADALGVRRRDVTLVSGATSRVKIVDVTGADEELLHARVAALAAPASPAAGKPVGSRAVK